MSPAARFSKLSAAEFRAARKGVMKQHPLGLQSREARGCYTSTTSLGEVHCLQFASQKGGGVLAVDLGVHFACAPRFESAFSPPHPNVFLADECCFRKRLHAPGGEQFFPFGDSTEEAAQITRLVADRSLQLFSDFETTWGDGRRLLEELPPTLMRRDASRFSKLLAAPFDQQSRLAEKMRTRQLFPEWYTFILPLCWLLAYLSLRFESRKLAAEYVEVARHPSQAHIANHYAVDLSTVLEQEIAAGSA